MDKTIETKYHDAMVENHRFKERRDDRRRQLFAEARVKIEAQLDEEFPETADVQQAEEQAKREYFDARIAEGKKRLAGMNYHKGLLVEWDRRKNEWFTDRRNWLYKTGRRGVLEVCDYDTTFPENMADYRRPKPGDLFIRRVKANGEPSQQIITLHDGHVPTRWHPEGEIPEQAAENHA